MGNKPKEKRTSEIIAEARKRADYGLSQDKHNRDAAYDDLRMKVGEDHWKDGATDFKQQRIDDGRPSMEFNRLPSLSSQVIGDLRANRPSCKIHPADNMASIAMATYFEGRIRQIEADCNAETIYDNGAQQMADSGFGAWRIVTDYIDVNLEAPYSAQAMYQTARIESIENSMAVIWDPLSQRWDKSDAQWGMILKRLHKDDYKKEYGGKSASNFETTRGGPNWYLDNTYTICEYFRRESDGTKCIYLVPEEDTYIEDEELREKWEELKVEHSMILGQVVDTLPDNMKEVWPSLIKIGVAKERIIKKSKIMRYLLSGHEQLEEPQEWVSNKYWPIVPVEGKSTNIDGKVYRKSVIRDAKNSQKAYNFAWNTTLEDVALVPKAPVFATIKQVGKFEHIYKLLHKKTFGYVPYVADPDAPGPPRRIERAQASTAITEIAMRAVDDMRAMTNVFDPSMMQPDPDVSGKAITARVSRSGIANYEFIDNVSRSIALTWRILLDILPKVEDTKREVGVRDEQGTVTKEKINWPNESMEQNAPPVINDMTKAGLYNVTVTVGPNYATQRMEASDFLTKLASAMPDLNSVLGDEIMRLQDYPGAQKMRLRLMAAMVLGGKGFLFEEKELKELLTKYPQLAPKIMPQPNPLMVAKAKKDGALAIKAEADAMKTMTEIDQIKSDTAMQLMAIIDRFAMSLQGQNPAGQGQGPKSGQGQPVDMANVPGQL